MCTNLEISASTSLSKRIWAANLPIRHHTHAERDRETDSHDCENPADVDHNAEKIKDQLRNRPIEFSLFRFEQGLGRRSVVGLAGLSTLFLRAHRT